MWTVESIFGGEITLLSEEIALYRIRPKNEFKQLAEGYGITYKLVTPEVVLVY